MIDYLDYQSIIESGAMPLTVAIVLGFMSIIMPCPLTTNISALAYITKDLTNCKKMLFNGLLYVLGKTLTHAILGFIGISIINHGMSIDTIEEFISSYGDKLMPPVLLLMALITFKPNIFTFWKKKEECGCGCNCHQSTDKYKGSIGAFMMGMVFALAFCPINGVIFFGILLPISAPHGVLGYIYPVIYGFITAIPVFILIYLIKLGVDRINSFKDNMSKIEKWTRYTIASILLVSSIYSFNHALSHVHGDCGCHEHSEGHHHEHCHDHHHDHEHCHEHKH